jgi:hypothetical protein
MRAPREALGLTDEELAAVRPTTWPAAAREVGLAQARALSRFDTAESLSEEPQTRRSGWLRKLIERIRQGRP